MSTHSPREVILTATVAIFSPDMREVIMVINTRLNRIVPPGGKFDSEKDRDILETALRETGEEIGLGLFPATGIFLDEKGSEIFDAKPVRIEPFAFIDNQAKGIDSLYFFRLHENPQFDLKGETQGFWFSRKEVQLEKVSINGHTYEVLFPGIREAILQVMK